MISQHVHAEQIPTPYPYRAELKRTKLHLLVQNLVTSSYPLQLSLIDNDGYTRESVILFNVTMFPFDDKKAIKISNDSEFDIRADTGGGQLLWRQISNVGKMMVMELAVKVVKHLEMYMRWKLLSTEGKFITDFGLMSYVVKLPVSASLPRTVLHGLISTVPGYSRTAPVQERADSPEDFDFLDWMEPSALPDRPAPHTCRTTETTD